MDKQIKNAVSEVVSTLVQQNAVKAAKYISPKLVVRVTRKRFGGKIRKSDGFEAMLVVGKPNHAQREFIKRCRKAGEPFPVKKVQLGFSKN